MQCIVAVKKKMAELDVSLRQCQQDVVIPDVVLTIHPDIIEAQEQVLH